MASPCGAPDPHPPSAAAPMRNTAIPVQRMGNLLLCYAWPAPESRDRPRASVSVLPEDGSHDATGDDRRLRAGRCGRPGVTVVVNRQQLAVVVRVRRNVRGVVLAR